MKYKGYTASFSMLPQSWFPVEHTSPSWKPCLACMVTILSLNTAHPSKQLTTLNGGSSVSPSLPTLDKSQVHPKYLTLLPSQMQACLPGSALSLKADGEPGTSFQGGRQMAEILAGLSPLASNSLYATSLLNVPKPPFLRHTETTGVLLKDGGRAIAETGPQISLSKGFMSSLLPQNPLSLPAMY